MIYIATDIHGRKWTPEQQEQRLTITYDGGQFKVTVELMALLATWPADDLLYLVDNYDNPVKIIDACDMLVHCRQRWYEVLNDWHNQHAELKKVRRGAKSSGCWNLDLD